MKKSILITQHEILPEYNGQVFSYGNLKLPESTMIVNLTSAHNCPGKAAGLCKVENICYAHRGEHRHPLYLRKNLIVEKWLKCAEEKDIITMLDAYILNAPTQIKYLRISEAGDFRDQQTVDLWNAICGYLKQRYGIQAYTYTVRSDLDFRRANNIIVNASVPGVRGSARMFVCTPKEIFDNTQPDKNHYKCPADCCKCQMCATDKFRGIILCRQH